MRDERNLILSVCLFVVSCCVAVLFLPGVVQSQQGSVILIVEDGAGPPSSTANPVLITLDNIDDRSTGVKSIYAGPDFLRSVAVQRPPALQGFPVSPPLIRLTQIVRADYQTGSFSLVLPVISLKREQVL